MKCIYCNTQTELTSSDIITYAITGAKLKKSFVCHAHNAFTNDNYEKKFVADLDFFRNRLGLSTRDGEPIQYRADITVDGTEVHNVKLSNRESLYDPKGVVTGVGNDGNKILMAPVEKIEKISKGAATAVDIRDVTLHKVIESNSFTGFHAVHSIAKMAYEWYCYINNIEDFKEECNEIVGYILGENEDDLVNVIIDGNYYYATDQLSEVGTNTFFQYDDPDGYRYVVFDFWNTISYRVRICKSPSGCTFNACHLLFNAYLYHIDGTKSTSTFGIFRFDNSKNPLFHTIQPQQITIELWGELVKRIEKIMSTMVLSIHTLKREVDLLSVKLKKYDEGKLDIAHLLGFEENNIVITVDIISQLYLNKTRYDMSKPFDANLRMILNLTSDTITETQEDKTAFVSFLVALDKDKKLSEYMWNGICTFYDVYENEMTLAKPDQ